MIPVANIILSILTIIAQAGMVAIVLALIFQKRFPSLSRFTKSISANALLASFVITLIATFGSLFYSEIAHYEPCKLCWIQRIFMYPQALLFLIAYLKKDRWILLYTLTLSIIGIIIATYHYLLQINLIDEVLPCSAVGYSVSCAEKFVMNFGYITIPMMALSAFGLLIMIYVSSYRNIKEN